MYPPEYLYTKEHEWIQTTVEPKIGRIGITDYAQSQLGDVVYLDLPEVGLSFGQGEQFGSVESVKAVSDLYLPVSGKILEVNAEAVSSPELINSDPHSTWLVEIEIIQPDELSALLHSADYESLTK